jgi:hypothetical protein
VFQNLKLKHFTYRNQKRFSTAEIAARVQIVQAVQNVPIVPGDRKAARWRIGLP